MCGSTRRTAGAPSSRRPSCGPRTPTTACSSTPPRWTSTATSSVEISSSSSAQERFALSATGSHSPQPGRPAQRADCGSSTSGDFRASSSTPVRWTRSAGRLEAAVAPTGLRVAFINGTSNLNEIWGYDVGLRARYGLATDSAPVGAVSWAPAANRIAYLRHDLSTTSLRVRNLSGAASTTTVTTGDLGRPAWLPDSTHLVFAA